MVKRTVALLGEVIREELGEESYQRIEKVRKRMAGIRRARSAATAKVLRSTYALLEGLTPEERRAFARAYTLMFELMNACESAYRTHRLRARGPVETSAKGRKSRAIFYVLTAHPTEARSPDNIEIFHTLQNTIVEAYERGVEAYEARLRALLSIAWHVKIVRYRKPRVQDEAEHIYSLALRDENLSLLLDYSESEVPFYLRSWVGGDKDGHPGVNARVMRASLQLSRDRLVAYAETRTSEALRYIEWTTHSALLMHGRKFKKALGQVRHVRPGDGPRIVQVHRALHAWTEAYGAVIGPLPLPLRQLRQFIRSFPGMVVPLELREDSAVLLTDPSGKRLAIGAMLRAIRSIAAGVDSRWYARGLVVSMASTFEHIRVASEVVRRNAGDARLRIVPLFEERAALENGHLVLAEILNDRRFRRRIREAWDNRFEVMLGYSDSSKESGVLKSRLAVVAAMAKMDRALKRSHVQPIFFHGSGGSIDRGGGSVSEQMAPWPKSALEVYKATIQGEMVERTFASPEIIRSRLAKIASAPAGRRRSHSAKTSGALEDFADRVAREYAITIEEPRFLRMVERATPYRFLNALKIGSRPTRRTGALSVSALRAIPWVLCWTQTRVLFQTWWGIGTAWEETSAADRAIIRREMKANPLFRSFVQALGFTVAKVELPVWEFYLERSDLPAEEIRHFRKRFRAEFASTRKFFREVTGHQDPLWFRPWLGESIDLRASLIHPLNVLEILALQKGDLPLLRICVTGVASGMLTTG